MRAERISAHIWSLSTWFPFPVRVWLVQAEDGVSLVDAGFGFMAKPILRQVERMGAGPLQRILLTHGHGDHVGAIPALLQQRQVPVYAHALEFPYMEGELPYPRRKRAEASVPKGLAQPLPMEPVAGLRPILTPGHSPGHLVYYHEEDQVLLAGDLFTSRSGQLRKPMAIFTADMAGAIQSAKVVGELKPKRLEVSHGGPVFNPAEQLESYLRGASA